MVSLKLAFNLLRKVPFIKRCELTCQRPEARSYLIKNPEIQFDDFVVAYSTNFDISWDYDPKHVLTSCDSEHPEDLCISPIFEEHVRKLKNWTVGDVFQKHFPSISNAMNRL
jgi:hypothetical protein